MPTFTAIALDRLLEPESSTTKKTTAAQRAPELLRMERRALSIPSRKPPPPPPPVFLSPELYKTPEATPVPDSPSSFPPSPYVLNHKGRGPRLQKNPGNVARNGEKEQRLTGDPSGANSRPIVKEPGQGALVDEKEESVVAIVDRMASDLERNDRVSDSPVESRNPVVLNSKALVDDRGVVDSSQKIQTYGEFFDAFDELSSDGGSTPVPNASFLDMEKELSEARISLLVEIERRKLAEETLNVMKNQWRRVAEQLQLAGISFPASPPNVVQCHENGELDSIAVDLQQQIFVVRYVSDAIAKGYARAEIELETEPDIEAKNFEISRLKDKVQYYETVNREMSQRNQEAIETARRERQRRKQRQKWVWGLSSLAISVGVAAVAWNYLAGVNDFTTSTQGQSTLDNTVKKEAA